MIFTAQQIPCDNARIKAIDFPFLASIGLAMPAHQLEIMTKVLILNLLYVNRQKADILRR